MEHTPINARVPDIEELYTLPREDLATSLLDRDPASLANLFAQLGDEALADLFTKLDPSDAAHLIRKLSRAQAAQILEEMEMDDAVDVVGELEQKEAQGILTAMHPFEAQNLRELLSYPPDSAGGLMTTDFVALSPSVLAGQALIMLRESGEQARRIPYFYVVEPSARYLEGVLSLRELVLSPPNTPVGELVVRSPIKVHVEADQEEAALLLDQHNLRALPVVDDEDRLLGIITADDAAKVLLEEAHEDIERLGGSQPLEEPYLRTSIFHLFRKRIPWLLVLFVAQAYTGSVLRLYQDTLAEEVALIFFIPLLIGTGGNTGSQTATTLVRSMSLGEVDPGDVLRVMAKEMGVSLMLGAVMCLATIIRAWTLGVGIGIAQVVGITALCVVVWAALVAAVLPLALRKLRLDPAVISGPFITTLVDGTGLIIYFNIAHFLLSLK
ncbi:MAG: magnesium transporter [Dehalococcoidia bacterium]|nr:magnesium transporter [Dehalococcoidia bacterium]